MNNLLNCSHWQDYLSVPSGRYGVIYGGVSAERDISLMSGQQILMYLQQISVDAFGIDLGSDGQQVVSQLQDHSMDGAFIAVHGRGGEDGRLQALLEMMGIPYTGSGVLASSLGMNKLMTKQIWQSQGLATPACCSLTAASNWHQVVDELGLPLVVKPVHQGSSLGISLVERQADLADAYHVAAAYDHQVMAEKYIDGEEYTVAILAGQALPAIRLQTENRFYDLQAKYYSATTRYLFDNAMTAAQQVNMEGECVQAFTALDCRGWGRIDLIRDLQGHNWLLEVNTVPGMTDHSLVPIAALQVGLDFSQLVLVILNQALTSRGRVYD
jgi:D-alanine-D-alanine ligase